MINIQNNENILKIRGVKGSILPDLFPKRRGPPGYGPCTLNLKMKHNEFVNLSNKRKTWRHILIEDLQNSITCNYA